MKLKEYIIKENQERIYNIETFFILFKRRLSLLSLEEQKNIIRQAIEMCPGKLEEHEKQLLIHSYPESTLLNLLHINNKNISNAILRPLNIVATITDQDKVIVHPITFLKESESQWIGYQEFINLIKERLYALDDSYDDILIEYIFTKYSERYFTPDLNEIGDPRNFIYNWVKVHPANRLEPVLCSLLNIKFITDESELRFKLHPISFLKESKKYTLKYEIVDLIMKRAESISSDKLKQIIETCINGTFISPYREREINMISDWPRHTLLNHLNHLITDRSSNHSEKAFMYIATQFGIKMKQHHHKGFEVHPITHLREENNPEKNWPVVDFLVFTKMVKDRIDNLSLEQIDNELRECAIKCFVDTKQYNSEAGARMSLSKFTNSPSDLKLLKYAIISMIMQIDFHFDRFVYFEKLLQFKAKIDWRNQRVFVHPITYF